MNSKQISLITLAACSLAVLSAGCCSLENKSPYAGIPQIQRQPDNEAVGIGGNTQITVQVPRGDNDDYIFEWNRLVAATNCADPDTFTYQLQKNLRPGWDANSLQIINANRADEGHYFCVVSPRSH